MDSMRAGGQVDAAMPADATGAGAPAAVAAAVSFQTAFLVLLGVFTALVLLSWPIVFSFDLWVLKDRSNLLNVDYLLEQHLRLGVDAYYIYGLLPVALQHLAFLAWGRGYWPMLGFNAVYIVLLCVFWAWFVRRTPAPRQWLLAILACSPILVWVNPNFPYVLVQLSVLFSLLLVYQRRLSAALCVAVIGCYSVPSLPLITAAMISLLILLAGWRSPGRGPGGIVRAFAPAAVVFLALGLVFTALYGLESVVDTVLPVNGAQFYKINHYGLFNRGSGLDFLYPVNTGLRYYLAGHAAWWIASTLVLFALGALAAYTSLKRRELTGAAAVVLICTVLHGVFAFYAYSVPPQHIIYDPLLFLGTFAGLAWLPLGAWRNIGLWGLVALGLLGNWAQVHETYSAWRETRPTAQTAGLYAQAGWAREWGDILRLADQRPLLLLSYGTGGHIYFPRIRTADSWTLQNGQMLPADLDRLQAKIAASDIVVEDLSGPTTLIEGNARIRQAMSSFCLTGSTASFKTFWNRAAGRCPAEPQ